MNNPRAFTEEEVIEQFLNNVRELATYWGEMEEESPSLRCHGLAFSILSLINGGSGGFPSLDLVVSPHPDYKEYLIKMGRNWYEDGMIINNCMLHEMYYSEDKS